MRTSEKNKILHEALKAALENEHIGNQIMRIMQAYDDDLELEDIVAYWETFINRV